MDELYAAARPRITAQMLPKYIGSYVTMMGTVDPSQISADGNSFQLTVAENKSVQVILNTPLNELLNDVVEVTGKVDNFNQIQCVMYRKLKSTVPMNLQDYNSTIEMIDKSPSCYSYAA